MSEQDLDELLTRIPVPSYDVHDDVARGQLALRRRNVGLSAAGLVLTATFGTALLFQGSWGGGTAPQLAGSSATPSADAPAQTLEPEPLVTPSRPTKGAEPDRPLPPANYEEAGPVLRAWRDVLAEHLGDRVRWAENSQSGGEALGSKYDWAGGGMLEIMVGSRWNDIAGFVGFTARDRTTFRGLDARTWTGENGDLLVSVKHADGTVVSLYASTSFGNNGTSTNALGLTIDDLLDAAADKRLRFPG